MTQDLELQPDDPLPRLPQPTGKGGLRPLDSNRLIDAAPPARAPAQRTHYFCGASSNDLLGGDRREYAMASWGMHLRRYPRPGTSMTGS